MWNGQKVFVPVDSESTVASVFQWLQASLLGVSAPFLFSGTQLVRESDSDQFLAKDTPVQPMAERGLRLLLTEETMGLDLFD